jgi:hypothetical protein
MSHELDTAAAGSLGGFLRWRRRSGHELPAGTPCANCATPLQGRWCHQCGQLGEDFHRSALKLVAEAVEGLFHFDGRLWRTLPRLVRDPGGLTRDYLTGHRAPQIPPLRLFLVVLLVVFMVGSLTPKHNHGVNLASVNTKDGDSKSLSELTPAEREKIKAATAKVHVKLGSDHDDVAATNWLQQRLQRAIDEPERFFLVLETWGERFAFLMLPLSTLLMSLAFFWRRDVFIFDHVIFSLHSLSFLGLLVSLSMLAPFDFVEFALIAAPVHLFFHLRGVYRTSLFGTLARMAFLFIGSLIGVVLIIIGLIAVGLNAMT